MTPKPIADRVAEEARAIRRLAQALLRDDARAADLSQDVLLAGLQGDPPSGVRLRVWLAGVARNLAMRHRRDERLRRRHEAAASRCEPIEDLTAQRLELHERLTAALRGLPEPYRSVVTLRFFEGLAPREIARRSGRSPEAVRQQVRRGLEMLRRELDGEYGERGAWAGLLVGWGAWSGFVFGGIVLSAKKWAAGLAVVLLVGVLGATLVVHPSAGERDGLLGSRALADDAKERPAFGPRSDDAAEAGAVAARVEVASRSTRVRILTAGREPVPGASVLVWSDDEASTSVHSGPGGFAEFPTPEGAGGVLVRATGQAAKLVRVEEWSALREVVFDVAVSVSGAVWIDGLPAAGIGLTLAGAKPVVPFQLPAGVLEQWQQVDRELSTDARGRFRFEGVASDWSGQLTVARGHSLVAEHHRQRAGSELRSLPLEAPREGIELHLGRWPSFSGRVVWAGSGEPVEGATVSSFVAFGWESSGLLWEITDEQGRFVERLGPGGATEVDRWISPELVGAPTEVKIWAEAPESTTRVERVLSAAELPSRLEELGVVLELTRAPTLHFLALDAETGEPVEGARVEWGGVPSAATEPDGRGSFRRDTAKGPFLVGSPTHQIECLEPVAASRGTLEDPLVFRLRPVNRLSVVVRASAEALEVLRGAAIRTAGEFLCVDGWPGTTGLHREFGYPLLSGWVKKDDGELVGELDRQGRLDAWCVRPGVAVQIEISDGFGRVLASRETVTPPLGEHAELVFDLNLAVCSLEGVVVDTNDRPVADARVRLELAESADGRSLRADSDRQGRFAFRGAFGADPVRLVVTRAGFAQEIVGPFPADAAPASVRAVLRAGQTVDVEVVGPDGQPVLGVVPQAEHQRERAIRFAQLGGHRFRFEDVPPGPIPFHCEVAGRRIELLHDSRVPTARLVLPTRPVAVVVEPRVGWAAPEGTHLEVQATPLDGVPGRTFSLRITYPDGERRETLLFPGRYRIQESLREFERAGRARRRELLGEPWEITVRAGEPLELRLR